MARVAAAGARVAEMADYLQWMNFAGGSGMFRPMIERMILRLARDHVTRDVAFIYVGGSRRMHDFAEAALASRPCFAELAAT